MEPLQYFKKEENYNKLEKSFKSLIKIDTNLAKQIWELGILHQKLLKNKEIYDITINDTLWNYLFFLMDIAFKENYERHSSTSLWILKFLFYNFTKNDKIESRINFYNLKSYLNFKCFLLEEIIKRKKFEILFNYFIIFSSYEIIQEKISFDEIVSTLEISIPLLNKYSFRFENLNKMFYFFNLANPYFHFSYLDKNTKLLFSYYFEFFKCFLPNINLEQITKFNKNKEIKLLFQNNTDLLKSIGEKNYKVGVLCNFFHRNHSVTKDRLLYLFYLQEEFNWNITLYSHYDLDLNPILEFNNALKNMNFIKLENNLDKNNIFLIKENLDIMIYPEIGMDEKVFLLASSGRYATIQINFWGHSDTSGFSNLIDEYWISKYFFFNNMQNNQFIEKIRIFEDLTTIYPEIKLSKDILKNPPFQLPRMIDNKKIINIFCGYAFMKMNNSILKQLNKIAKYFENKKEIRFICLNPNIKKSNDIIEWNLKLKNNFPYFYTNQILFETLETDKYRYLLSICDIFIDSYPFGSCNSILEAMALGTDVLFIPSEYLAGRFALGFKLFLEKADQNNPLILTQKNKLGKKGKLIQFSNYNEIISFIEKIS